MRDESLVIEKPQVQTLSQRVVGRVLTVLFWLLYLYLWRPLLFLTAWLLGLRTFSKVMVAAEGYRDLIRLLGCFLMIILGIGLVLEGWSLYNLLRFRKREKRIGTPSSVPVPELAVTFGVAAEDLARWLRARHLRMGHDAEGRILKVECG